MRPAEEFDRLVNPALLICDEPRQMQRIEIFWRCGTHLPIQQLSLDQSAGAVMTNGGLEERLEFGG
jgi:hypothetical protein